MQIGTAGRCRHIELNPVAAGMQRHPGDYPWFSFRCNAWGTLDDLVCSHPLYLALGEDALSRQSSYRALFISLLPKEVVHEIRMTLDFSMPLGNDQFRQQIERAPGRSIG